MQYTEAEYIQRINALQAELDEANQLVEQSYTLIEELKLKLSLADSSFTKKGMSTKKEQSYKDKIAELEQCVDLFSTEYMSSKADEIDSYLKRLISIKNDLEALKKAKRVREYSIEAIEISLHGLAEELANRYLSLMKVIDNFGEPKEMNEDDLRKYVRNIHESVVILREVLTFKENRIIRANKELDRLKRDIVEFTGSSETVSELKRQLENKSAEAKAYKDKAEALEIELNRLKSTKNS